MLLRAVVVCGRVGVGVGVGVAAVGHIGIGVARYVASLICDTLFFFIVCAGVGLDSLSRREVGCSIWCVSWLYSSNPRLPRPLLYLHPFFRSHPLV